MKFQIAILLILGFSSEIQTQTIVANFQENQDIRWGSVSAQGPSFGFYGQEFTFSKNIKLKSISVFIFDHRDHDEAKSTVNFSIWGFNDKPSRELFRSDSIKVDSKEINGWKTYTFKKSKKLKKGKYLIGIGQPQIQGFVGFGMGTAKQGYKSKFWARMPFEGFSDGTKWLDMADTVKSMGASEEEIKMMESAVVMMKLEYK